MRMGGNALQATLDCLRERIDVRRDAFEMAAYERMHSNLRREALPFRRKIPAAADNVVG
jgi:hypothetical protein